MANTESKTSELHGSGAKKHEVPSQDLKVPLLDGSMQGQSVMHEGGSAPPQHGAEGSGVHAPPGPYVLVPGPGHDAKKEKPVEFSRS